MTTEQSSAEQITETPSNDRDPLAGFSPPDKIIVGAGGETVAQAAAAETASAPATESDPVSFAVRCACDIATGAAKDDTASAICGRAAWRACNAKGNGSETYRRALSPGGTWRFVSSERLPRGTFLAADRNCVIRGDVFVGDLVAEYDRALSHGKSRGEAKHDGKIGLVIGAEIEWMDVVRQKDGKWRIILPTGAHLTFESAGWR